MKKYQLTLITLASFPLMAGTIYLNQLDNYSNQTIPDYITKDNIAGNPISDIGATLGRVLFYDKNLSVNNTISCASCHKQEFAFGDTAVQSTGFDGGLTGRHSMRLINSRFSDEVKFFWDERATSLENQTTQPIQDHIEMGFSGTNGQPDLDSLISKLEAIPYYQVLFESAYGDTAINESRIQNALAQFIRSIQSFDSKFDEGRALVNNNNQNFPNFTTEENLGKQLFLDPPPAGGAGCAGCHRPPEFDIDPNSGNNGITGVAGSSVGSDYTNTRAPSLRDLVNPNGILNGPLMHTGEINSLEELTEHYNAIPNDPNNLNLDPRLAGPGGNLSLTIEEKQNLIAFLKTLTGSDVYINEKWSNPFDDNENLTLVVNPVSYTDEKANSSILKIYPNPAKEYLYVEIDDFNWKARIYNLHGYEVLSVEMNTSKINLSSINQGTYILVLTTSDGEKLTQRFIVN